MRRLLARVRARGRARPRPSCSRAWPPSTSRSSRAARPTRRRGSRAAARRRRDRPVELRPVRPARRRRARRAARGRRRACSSCGGPSARRAVAERRRRRRDLAPRGAAARARGGLRPAARARPADPGALDAAARGDRRRSRSRRRSWRVRAAGGSGCARSRCAALAAAWLAAGRWPSPGAPLGGLAGSLADAPSAWVQVVLPFARDEHPELRAAVLIALFAWLAALAWLWLVRPRPLAAGLLALLPFAVSATVYDLPQEPAGGRSPPARSCSRSCAPGAPPGGGPRDRGRLRRRSPARRRRLDAAVPAASGPALLPWTTWNFTHAASDASAVGLAWDMRYQPLVYPPEAGRGAAGARRRARRTGAPSCSSDFDGLRFTRAAAGDRRRAQRGGAVRVPARARRDAAARRGRRSRRSPTPFLVAPGEPVRYDLPAAAGAVDARARTARPSSGSRPSAGLRLPRRGRRAGSPGDGAARAARRLSGRRRAASCGFAGERAAGLRRRGSRAATRRALPRAPRRSGLARVAERPTRRRAPSRAAPRRPTRRSSRSRPGCARRAPTTSMRASPDRPDALARWAAVGHRRLLPDVRRLAGRARAPLGRAGARRRGLRAGRPARRRLPRDRSRRPRVGRGLVPGLRLAAVRRDAGARAARRGRRRRRRRSTARRRRRVRRRAAARPACRACSCRSARLRGARGARGPRRVARHAWWRPPIALLPALLAACSSPLRCSRKRALLRLALPRRSGARGARSASAPSPPIRGVELGAGAHAARARGRARARASASRATASRARSSARPTPRRARGDDAAPRGRDGRAAARAAAVARARPAACAARSRSRLSAARGRAR